MASKKVVTRQNRKHSVFGYPEKLRNSQLPRKEDVFKHYLWHRSKAFDGDEKTASTKDIVKQVADDVINIWHKASIPNIAYRSVVKSVEKLIVMGKNLQKYQPQKRSSKSFKSEENSFKEVFDICPCKCLNKGIMDRKQCRCAVKVPLIEWEFWCDQMSERKMEIGPVDKDTSHVLQQRCSRQERAQNYMQSMFSGPSTGDIVTYHVAGNLTHEGNDSQEHEYDRSTDSDSQSCDFGQNRRQYPNLCGIIERTALSNRDVCKVINACLQDMRLDQPENLLEATKLRRQRIYWRQKEVDKHSQKLQQLCCIGFDGRIDDTRVLEAARIARTKREDHYVIVAFPQVQYVDHISPQSGKSNDICAEILSVINDTCSTDTLCAIACDGTNVNTGEHNGVITLLEKALSRPLQWLICMLHLNELPFKEIFKIIDGDTSGPHGLKGPVGSKLDFDPSTLPIVSFEKIAGNVINVDDDIKKEFSQDQKYLLKACLAIQSGQKAANSCDLHFLQTASPGKLCNARWLTRANRTLRLYMGTKNPSVELKKLVSFIATVYVPTWFQIKTHPRACDGAVNFFFLVRKCRDLSDSRMREVAEKTLRRNSYFAHPENILIAALDDSDIAVRKDAAQKIVRARKYTTAYENFRRFSKTSLKLNFSAESYYNLVDWTSCIVTPPPMISFISDDALMAAVELGPVLMPKFPCHTQAVERAVKDVTKVSTKVFGHDSRHGMLVTADVSRKKRPKLDTKYSFAH